MFVILLFSHYEESQPNILMVKSCGFSTFIHRTALVNSLDGRFENDMSNLKSRLFISRSPMSCTKLNEDLQDVLPFYPRLVGEN